MGPSCRRTLFYGALTETPRQKKEPVCRREEPAALRVVVVLGRYRADRILITVAGAALDSHVAHQTSLLTHPSLGWWAPNAANDKRPPS